MSYCSHDKETLSRWFERLARVMPGPRLIAHDVWISGGPWNTVVNIRWTATAELSDGTAYRKHGVHIVRMHWGTAFEIDANENS